MANRVQDKKPKRSKSSELWLRDSIAGQRVRHQAIAQEMASLEPTRQKWYEDFLQIIQTKGFNVTGDTRRRIPEHEIPKRPKREDRVIW